MKYKGKEEELLRRLAQKYQKGDEKGDAKGGEKGGKKGGGGAGGGAEVCACARGVREGEWGRVGASGGGVHLIPYFLPPGVAMAFV